MNPSYGVSVTLKCGKTLRNGREGVVQDWRVVFNRPGVTERAHVHFISVKLHCLDMLRQLGVELLVRT